MRESETYYVPNWYGEDEAQKLSEVMAIAFGKPIAVKVLEEGNSPPPTKEA